MGFVAGVRVWLCSARAEGQWWSCAQINGRAWRRRWRPVGAGQDDRTAAAIGLHCGDTHHATAAAAHGDGGGYGWWWQRAV
jgi:hypothetical protein